VKACADQFNPCAENALCTANNHRASCTCRKGMNGDPFVNCLREAVTSECTDNSECAVTEACINKKCQNPCSLNECAANSECRVSNHRASKF
jgi:hypothetical protein